MENNRSNDSKVLTSEPVKFSKDSVECCIEDNFQLGYYEHSPTGSKQRDRYNIEKTTSFIKATSCNSNSYKLNEWDGGSLPCPPPEKLYDVGAIHTHSCSKIISHFGVPSSCRCDGTAKYIIDSAGNDIEDSDCSKILAKRNQLPADNAKDEDSFCDAYPSQCAQDSDDEEEEEDDEKKSKLEKLVEEIEEVCGGGSPVSLTEGHSSSNKQTICGKYLSVLKLFSAEYNRLKHEGNTLQANFIEKMGLKYGKAIIKAAKSGFVIGAEILGVSSIYEAITGETFRPEHTKLSSIDRTIAIIDALISVTPTSAAYKAIKIGIKGLGGTKIAGIIGPKLIKQADFAAEAVKNGAKGFENAIKNLPPGERIARIKYVATIVAKKHNWKKNSKLSKMNNRTVYTDKKGNHWSVDTQHGRFEKLDKKGKHIDEYDIDLQPKNKKDSSGGHDIII